MYLNHRTCIPSEPTNEQVNLLNTMCRRNDFAEVGTFYQKDIKDCYRLKTPEQLLNSLSRTYSYMLDLEDYLSIVSISTEKCVDGVSKITEACKESVDGLLRLISKKYAQFLLPRTGSMKEHYSDLALLNEAVFSLYRDSHTDPIHYLKDIYSNLRENAKEQAASSFANAVEVYNYLIESHSSLLTYSLEGFEEGYNELSYEKLAFFGLHAIDLYNELDIDYLYLRGAYTAVPTSEGFCSDYVSGRDVIDRGKKHLTFFAVIMKEWGLEVDMP
jgi:hypothetical protein